MAQVSGNKINQVTASKNLGTVINTQVSGNKVDAKHEYKKLTDVAPSQVSGEQILTNYNGVNDEGMDIFHTKKISGNELNVVTNPTAYATKNNIITAANELIATQEEDKKAKNRPAKTVVPELVSIAVTTPPTTTTYTEGATFDPTGMVITATYDDESTEVVTGYTYAPTTELATTDTEITISYEGKTTTQAITVEAAVVPNPAE